MNLFLLLGLYAVINNAGIMIPGPIEWQTLDDMEKVMNVNFWGVVRTTMTMLTLLKRAKGRIIMISSPTGKDSVIVLVIILIAMYL